MTYKWWSSKYWVRGQNFSKGVKYNKLEMLKLADSSMSEEYVCNMVGCK